MGLTWWPLAIAGFACLAVAVAMALLLPMERERRQLRPMANTSRLTRLPEYARLARARLMSTVATLVLLVLLFGAVMLAAARPTGWSWTVNSTERPEDIMLCVNQPVADQSTADFLTFFADQARTYGSERIGLTSPNRRVVPLTRDYQYAAERFGDLAQLAKPPADVPAPEAAAMRRDAARFSPRVTYADYATSTPDVLAMCLAGFPSFEPADSRRRSVIYLGPGEARGDDETRPSLFSAQDVEAEAIEAGVQINALTPPGQGSAALRSLAETTGGQAFPVQAGATMNSTLDDIRADPPRADANRTAAGWLGDSPNIPLVAAVVAAVLLCLALVVLRR
ncbi:hypothetical protein CQY20_09310 [Mycolicibacterium agri]|uniref:Uncharacterized protein n=1 Tax=Mycolicibacterium agri TaxID=36811 RepID=A0A2A7N8E1_MYCAG|nr:hypothetical protein [Mycolicibacterium agri]PEG39741.1 hypothetical protein CQY20_09310 [Mycolicibacterium agri]GFG52550.1 hypothetical protein MAGR_39910 [Mycolicibacterium agri]